MDNKSNKFRGIVFITVEYDSDIPLLINMLNGYKFDNQILYCKSSLDIKKYDWGT